MSDCIARSGARGTVRHEFVFLLPLGMATATARRRLCLHEVSSAFLHLWDVVLVIITRNSVPTGGENRGGRDVIIAGAKTRICGQNVGPHGLQLLFEMKLRLQNALAM